MTITLFGQTETRNGETYMQIRDLDYTVNNIRKLGLSVSGLFTVPLLNRLATEAIINSWSIIYDTILRPVWEIRVQEVFAAFYNAIPLRRLFV